MNIDTHSYTWEQVEIWANEQLAKLQRKLESPSLDLNETQQVRGRIIQLRELLKLKGE